MHVRPGIPLVFDRGKIIGKDLYSRVECGCWGGVLQWGNLVECLSEGGGSRLSLGLDVGYIFLILFLLWEMGMLWVVGYRQGNKSIGGQEGLIFYIYQTRSYLDLRLNFLYFLDKVAARAHSLLLIFWFFATISSTFANW